MQSILSRTKTLGTRSCVNGGWVKKRKAIIFFSVRFLLNVALRYQGGAQCFFY